jgi:NAD(P)-dependent dehydrogenase (short-subunit alcohol dehydrogenase family)
MSIALITGCSSGFGLLTAITFARRGDAVVATMRNPARATDLEKQAADEGVDVEVETLDVADEGSVRAAVRRILDKHGRIDVLVNNAGVGIEGAVEEVDDAALQAVFETNVFGLLRVTRAVLPTMRAQGEGVIINVSSLAGRVAPPFGGIYSASKWAVEALTEALHYELSPFGIRTVSIEPGGFATRFDANRLHAAGPSEGSPYAALKAKWESVYSNVPGRDQAADPQLVADAIYEAATDATHPRRRLVGSDAELIGQMRASLDDDAFEKTIRTALDFWDGY